MSARKLLFLQEFLSQTDALCCVGLRTCYDAGPRFNACGLARGMAQSGSASALGAEGRGFESLCPDQFRRVHSGDIIRAPTYRRAAMYYPGQLAIMRVPERGVHDFRAWT